MMTDKTCINYDAFITMKRAYDEKARLIAEKFLQYINEVDLWRETISYDERNINITTCDYMGDEVCFDLPADLLSMELEEAYRFIEETYKD